MAPDRAGAWNLTDGGIRRLYPQGWRLRFSFDSELAGAVPME